MKLSISLQLHSVELLGRVISSSQGLSNCTQTQKNAHTTQTQNIHALSEVKTVHFLERSATVTGGNDILVEIYFLYYNFTVFITKIAREQMNTTDQLCE
jgi:CO dehydrogenase/acetyl-CoA synthase gamma subunit (corrinoid Fe-S protein)